MMNVGRKRHSGLVGLLVLLLVSAFTNDRDAVADEEIFATVGDDVITLQEYQDFISDGMRRRFFHGRIPDEQQEAVRRELAQQLIDQYLLQQEARRRHIAADDDAVNAGLERQQQHWARAGIDTAGQETLRRRLRQLLQRDSQIEGLREQVSRIDQPAAAEVRQYYQAHPDKFTTPEKLRVSVILLAVEPWARAATWQAAVDEAQRLINNIEQGKETFEDLARLHSSDASAARGGDLGFIHRGMFAADAQQAVDVLQPGQISPPVRLLKGIAVFRLDERVAAALNPLDKVFERAQGLLQRERRAVAWQDLLAKLRSTTPVEIKWPVVETLTAPAATDQTM